MAKIIDGYKLRPGDRKDARWVRDVPGLQAIMTNLMPNRTDCEAYLDEELDVTEVLKYIDSKNAEHPEFRTTVFHCLIFSLAKMIWERPKMNRFIQGRRTYERYKISLSFVAKRRFHEKAQESLMFFTPSPSDTLDSLSKYVAGDISKMRESETATGGVDAIMDKLSKLPRLLLMFICYVVKVMDFWGVLPESLSAGDPNYSTVLLSNLGSVKCPSIYHHLNNYGSNSFFISTGVIHKEERVMGDGSRQIRDIMRVGVTIDERIGDGFYFARSIKLVKHMFAHPEMMNFPINEPSGFDYV